MHHPKVIIVAFVCSTTINDSALRTIMLTALAQYKMLLTMILTICWTPLMPLASNGGEALGGSGACASVLFFLVRGDRGNSGDAWGVNSHIFAIFPYVVWH
jgi:hypothetical protein